MDVSTTLPVRLPLPPTPAPFHVIQYRIVANDQRTTVQWNIRIVRTDDILATLSFSTGTLTPAFSPTVQSYVLSIPHADTDPIRAVAIRPTVQGTVTLDASRNSLATQENNVASDYDTGIDVITGGRIQLSIPLTQYIDLHIISPHFLVNAAGRGIPIGGAVNGYDPLLSKGMVALRIGAVGSQSNPKSDPLVSAGYFQRATQY